MSFYSNSSRLISLTKQLTSFVNQGRHEQALALFHHMQSSVVLDPPVFPLVLKSCAAIRHLQLGSAIHSFVGRMGPLSNPFVASALADMYGKCASVDTARKLFDEIRERNVVVWNVMVSLYTHSKMVREALLVFESMDVEPSVSTFNSLISGLAEMEDGAVKAISFYRKTMGEKLLKPNLITLLALLPACADLASLNFIREIHGFSVRNHIDPHPQIRSGIVEAYGRCGCLKSATTVFQTMNEKDVVPWSSLISAYALYGQAIAALEIFNQMELAKVRPDEITFLAVLKACSHAGLADEAIGYLNRMHGDYGLVASSDHYSCLIDVLSRAGRLSEAYEVISGMPVKATAKAWGALLAACRTHGEMELAVIAARALFEIEPDNPSTYVLLSTVYANAGRQEEADEIRSKMKELGVKVDPGGSWIL
ncbi:Putative pentatricopeptide repeat-containing protein At1g03510 [Linum perenne]